jgi:serine/threonine protein kinase
MRNEICYMNSMKHTFICSLRGAAQDDKNIYLLMDYMAHGELMNVLNLHKVMKSKMARFYAASIVLAFEYMHFKDLIYRDLKPENVLVTETGYVKLTDFGFVKKMKPWERTYTLCGTPEYIPPEVILNTGHGRAADWYTLGIFLYELMVGRPPFMAEDTYDVFKMTLRDPIKFPKDFNSNAKSLIKHLTSHDLSKRFGNMKNGIKDIKDHRFFKTLDFHELSAGKAEAPYVPPSKQAEVDKMMKKTGETVFDTAEY